MQLLVAAATLVSAIAGLVVAVRTGAKVSATHDLVNGQSARLETFTSTAAHSAGVAEGVAIERDRPPSE